MLAPMSLDDRSGDLLKALSGLLFAAGCVALWVRKGSLASELFEGDPWGGLLLTLVLFVPFAILYGLAFSREEVAVASATVDEVSATREGGAITTRAGETQTLAAGEVSAPWQTVFFVTAILLAIPMDFQFWDWIGANTEDGWIQALIFLFIAALAGVAARRGVPYAVLIAAFSLLFVWLSVWDELVDPGANGFRWLLFIFGAIALVAGLGVRAGNERSGNAVLTVAGIAAVLAFGFGIIAEYSGLQGDVIGAAFGGGIEDDSPIKQNVFWDFMLLATSLALIVGASRAGWRGLGYVGAIGLLGFLLSVGVQLGDVIEEVSKGEEFSAGILGWPLLLLIVGGLGLLAAFAGGAAGRSVPPAAPAPPAGGAPAGGAPPSSSSPGGATPPPSAPPGGAPPA